MTFGIYVSLLMIAVAVVVSLLIDRRDVRFAKLQKRHRTASRYQPDVTIVIAGRSGAQLVAHIRALSQLPYSKLHILVVIPGDRSSPAFRVIQRYMRQRSDLRLKIATNKSGKSIESVVARTVSTRLVLHLSQNMSLSSAAIDTAIPYFRDKTFQSLELASYKLPDNTLKSGAQALSVTIANHLRKLTTVRRTAPSAMQTGVIYRTLLLRRAPEAIATTYVQQAHIITNATSSQLPKIIVSISGSILALAVASLLISARDGLLLLLCILAVSVSLASAAQFGSPKISFDNRIAYILLAPLVLTLPLPFLLIRTISKAAWKHIQRGITVAHRSLLRMKIRLQYGLWF